MLDEWGYFEWSAMGHPILETPNIDNLAAEGMRFTQLLAGANVCAPTRSTLMTGQHTGHTTVRGQFRQCRSARGGLHHREHAQGGGLRHRRLWQVGPGRCGHDGRPGEAWSLIPFLATTTKGTPTPFTRSIWCEIARRCHSKATPATSSAGNVFPHADLRGEYEVHP